ncbi:LOG family protein [Flexivirga caeni]|uniref:Rossmann fold nucleotide-binding protein n=1 Tax=Flexivirga caeni TaxID=2294115 RepID=A0A3M9MFS1_9MICO|nr:LOG family protein [Flexivirga caeni]RNI24344.1 Rossmann fold nucleotide-binding protein [Flexivirga caeni]
MATSDVGSLAALRRLLTAGTPLRGLRLQDLDLAQVEPELLAIDDFTGVVVLGGRMSDRLHRHLGAHGALIFPADPGVPFDAWRAHLYRPRELYAGLREGGYAVTPDYRTYRWSLEPSTTQDVYASLLRAIHDHSIGDALDEFIAGRTVVGVMGGHDVDRGTAGYTTAARLGHALASAGSVVATGGGPGAMEAANLGALCTGDRSLDAALTSLAAVPSFQPDITAWARLALDVRDQIVRDEAETGSPRSLGIPTWFYGHEPPNVFAGRVAKYFSNALREDVLLHVCNGGIVVLPGAAGTVQEIFQLATSLYYADPARTLPALVLVGEEHWQHDLPVWDTLQALAAGRPMAHAIHLVNDVDTACRTIGCIANPQTSPSAAGGAPQA